MHFQSMATRVGVAAALTMAPLMLVSHMASANPSVLYVAPGGTNTNNNCQTNLNPCETISFALTQAQSGATIKVQAGTYTEHLKITQPVTIMGAGANQTVIEPTAVTSDADTDSTEPQFYIVDATHTTGVNLEDLGINGTAATPSLDTDGFGCGQDYVGAYFHDASGSMTHDTVTEINMPADLFSCQGGQGVYVNTDSTWATPSQVSFITDNVNNYDKNGITCDDPGTSCTIKNTTVTGIGSTPAIAQNGVQIWAASGNLSSDVITDNTYDGPTYSAAGILVGNPQTLRLKRNTVTHNDTDISLIQDQSPAWVYCGNPGTDCTNPSTPGTTFRFTANHVSDATNVDGNPVGSEFGDGIDLDSVTTPTLLKRNIVDGDPGNGIALYGTVAVTANANTVRSDDNGFYLGAGTVGVTANANTLRRNTVSSSLNDGILADSSSGGNTILHNNSQLNLSFDAQDNSTGPGTAGTDNSWEANVCTTSAPSGLCHTAASARAGHRSGVKKRKTSPGAVRRFRHLPVR